MPFGRENKTIRSLHHKSNGYMYIYLLNASSQKVYFDNLQIIKQRANVLARMDYYPFGLQWANSDPDESASKYGHTSKEMQDREWSSTEGLDWEDFGARMYDPVVGRWWSVDPLAQSFGNVSPYASLFNNPISFIDPTGMAPEWHWEGNELVSDEGDDINTLNAFLYTNLHIQIDWQQNNWDSQTGSKTEYPHINELYNLYTGHGGSDSGTKKGKVRLSAAEIEKFGKGQFKKSEGPDFDAIGYGINAVDAANGVKTELIKYAIESGGVKAGLDATVETIGTMGKTYLTVTSAASKGLGIIGVGVTAADAYQKGTWQNHHTADVLIGLGTTFMLTGPWGWAAAGAYFIVDYGVKSYTGRSVTEHLFD
jgi:RHS repeat-associated protein